MKNIITFTGLVLAGLATQAADFRTTCRVLGAGPNGPIAPPAQLEYSLEQTSSGGKYYTGEAEVLRFAGYTVTSL